MVKIDVQSLGKFQNFCFPFVLEHISHNYKKIK